MTTIASAARFLSLLDENAEHFIFQMATDAEPKPKPDPLACHVRLPVDGLDKLADRNRDGAAVWVMINAGNGRAAADVERIRAVFLDGDGQVTLSQLLQAGLEPHFIVESSPGHLQAYWLVDGLTVKQFEGVQRRIAQTFGTDSVCDACRVMRVPGYLHQKNPAHPFTVRIVHERQGMPYKPADILRTWPPLQGKVNGKANGEANGTLPPYPGQVAIDELLSDPAAAAYWHQKFTVIPSADQSASGWDLAFAGHLARQGRERKEIAGFLRAYRAHHDPTKGKQDRADYIWATVDLAIGEAEDDDETFTADADRNAKQHGRQYTLAEVHKVFRRWLGDEYDLATLNAVLAAAAAEKLPGDPLWLLVISGPGNAKTETVQALRGANAHVTSTIASEGALLSASSKRDRTKQATGGLLRKIGDRGLLVIKDVTSILSADRHVRGPVLAAIREVYDGRWERNVGTDGGRTLTWTGRIVLIGAVTTAWDAAHGVVSAMGDRFVLVRADSHSGRLVAGRRAMKNTGHEIAMRDELADAVGGLIGTVDPSRAVDLLEEEEERILCAANLVTLARTGVEFDYRGDVIDAHQPEMPTRFAKQLAQMLRGGVAIGMGRHEALVLAIRCARDSMPPLRLQLLRDVGTHRGARVIDIRRRLERPRATIDRQLQALHIIGLLLCVETEELRAGRLVQVRHYSLAPGLDLDALYDTRFVSE